MPMYDYYCNTCEHIFEDLNTMANSDKPTKEPCPECNEKTVRRGYFEAPQGGVDFNLTPDSATSGQWSELMNKMKKAQVINRAGKQNIDISTSRTGGRYGCQ